MNSKQLKRKAAFEALATALRPAMEIAAPKCTEPFAWAREYVRTERGHQLDFDAHSYMPQIIADQSPQKGFMCESQVGKTTMAIAEVFSLCDTWETPLRIIYTMHTDRAVKEFSQTRFKPAVEASPYLRGKIGGIDNMERKSVMRRDGQSIIFFKGASENQQALSEPADIVVHDELDYSRPDTLTLYQDRIAHSSVAWRRAFGTPTVPGFGLAALWDQSTQAEWMVRCPVCGSEDPITWPDSFALDAAVPYYICRHGHELTWEDHIQHGRWVRRKQDAGWSFYRIPRALMPNWSAERIAKSFEETEFPHIWINQVMGQPSTSGELTIDEAIINACMGEHRDADADAGPCFLGADPGAVIHYMIGKRADDDRHKYVSVGHVNTWDGLHRLMDLFNVRCAVIDGAYDPTKAREFVAAYPGRAWLAYYPSQPIRGTEPIRSDRNQRKVDLGRTDTLDVSAARLIEQRDILPRCDYDTHRELVSQLTAMVRGTKLGANNLPVNFWQEVRADHLRHAHNYATVAATLGGGIPSLPDVYKNMPAGGSIVTGIDAVTGKEVTLSARDYVIEPEGVIDRDPRAPIPPGPASDAAIIATYPAMKKIIDRLRKAENQ